jgi:hypothetical protein
VFHALQLGGKDMLARGLIHREPRVPRGKALGGHKAAQHHGPPTGISHMQKGFRYDFSPSLNPSEYNRSTSYFSITSRNVSSLASPWMRTK